jgi:hypothetical protein
MIAIYFIESKGIKYYKTDTFWSKSKDQLHAKEHDDSKDDQERFLESLLYFPNKGDKSKDDLVKTIEFYDNSIYGYQTLDDNKTILNTYHINLIQFDGEKFITSDYKQTLREEKINKIINE